MPGFREHAGRWSYGRQRLGRAAPDAGVALRAVVGVYSSHPSAPLSLHARARVFDHAAFRRLDAERRALRLPAMRGSIHLLPRETAHLAFRAVPEPPSGLKGRLECFAIPEGRYAELREAVLAANTLTRGTPAGRYNNRVTSTNGARGGGCGLCGRPVERLTRHHLVPRTRHKNKKNKKTFDRQEIHRTVGLCPPCHRHIHAVLDNRELERDYNTLEALKSHPDVERFVAWISKKPHGTITSNPRDPRP